MGYRDIVLSNTRKAFILISDLAVDATLTQNNPTGYNFASDALIGSSPASTTIKAVVLGKEKNPDSNQGSPNVITSRILIKSEDVSDLTIYDSIVIGGVTWNIVPPYADNGYTTTITISKEGT